MNAGNRKQNHSYEPGIGSDGNWPLTGKYIFTAELAEGYVCEPLPTVKVLVGGAELYATEDRTGAFTVTGESSQYEFNNSVLTIRDGANLTIKNTDPNVPTTNRIKVEDNATNVKITLAGVNIGGEGGAGIGAGSGYGELLIKRLCDICQIQCLGLCQ